MEQSTMTAENEPTEPASTFTPQTVTTRHLVNFRLHIKSGTTETIDNNKIGALCSYIVVRAIKQGRSYPQFNN